MFRHALLTATTAKRTNGTAEDCDAPGHGDLAARQRAPRVRGPSAELAVCTAFFVILASSQAMGQVGLAHRYSFTSNANDSVGTAHGTVIDAGATPSFSFTNETLDFSLNAGNPSNNITEDAYLDLPDGLISSTAASGAIAFEWWYTVSENRTWQRLGDFGTSNGGEDMSPSGSTSPYLSVVTTSGRGNVVDMTNHTTTGFEPVIGLPGTPVLNQTYHVMAVYNHNNKRSFTAQGSNGTMTLYTDGVRRGFAAIHPDINIRTFNDLNNWLGRSQWPDPLFDGAFDEFRIYNRAPSDAYVTASFAAGPNSLAPFQEFTPEFDLSLVVDRSNGTFSLKNTVGSIDVVIITINSPSGAIDPTKWLSVTNTYDADSGGATPFDSDNLWNITTQTANSLSETAPTGDGGQLGPTGKKASLQLGDINAWTKSRFEDLTVTIQRLNADFSVENLPVRVVYEGGIGRAAARADLDFDGLLTGSDWTLFAAGHNTDLSALTVAQASTKGDLNGDKFNNYDDFLLFRTDYIAANGAAAFAALMGVPEPSSVVMLLVAGCAAMGVRRRKAKSSGSVRSSRACSN